MSWALNEPDKCSLFYSISANVWFWWYYRDPNKCRRGTGNNAETVVKVHKFKTEIQLINQVDVKRKL